MLSRLISVTYFPLRFLNKEYATYSSHTQHILKAHAVVRNIFSSGESVDAPLLFQWPYSVRNAVAQLYLQIKDTSVLETEFAALIIELLNHNHLIAKTDAHFFRDQAYTFFMKLRQHDPAVIVMLMPLIKKWPYLATFPSLPRLLLYA